jgi:hypothetical protein
MKLIHKLLTLLVILALVACSQTSATRKTSPGQEETRQTSPDKADSSSALPEPGQQTTRKESQIPGAASNETNQETSDQKSDSISPQTDGTESQEIDRPSTVGQEAAGESADAKLAKAKENLRISRETEKRIAAELEELKASGSASAEAIRDYETYLKSVQAMTAENRKIVEQMEAAYARKALSESGSGPTAGSQSTGPDIPEQQITDEVEALDRQLNASLAKFDGMLLKEMEEIRSGSSEKLQELAEEAADAARRLREKGLDVSTSESGSSEETREGDENTPSSDQEMESSEGRSGTDTAAKTGSSKSGDGSSHRDKRRANYEDDDIVARQLREAAENETDPELKEKLWKEYEEYKKSQ